MGKEGMWVLGLTEVDNGSHPIQNPRFLQMLKDGEDNRERRAGERAEQRRLVKERNSLRRRGEVQRQAAHSSRPRLANEDVRVN